MGGISDWPEFNARYAPASPAIVFGGRTETWAEFEHAVAHIAGGLRRNGVRHGDRVGILAQNHPHYLHVVLGAARIGAVIVPLNIRLSVTELRYQITHSGLVWLFRDASFARTAAGFEDLIPAARSTEIDGPSMAELLGGDGVRAAADVTPDDPVAILYTSGTTGLPKAAVLTHRNVAAVAEASGRCDSVGSDDRVLIAVPLAFTGPLLPTAMPFVAAGASILLAKEAHIDDIFDAIERQRVTVLSQVPLVYQKMEQHPRFRSAELSGLRSARSGGSPIPESLIARWQERGVALVGSYGLTEASGLALQLPAAEASRKIGSAGVPILHHQIRVLDADGRECAPGRVGELQVRGPAVMSHYLNDEQATAAAFDGEWLRTGDLVELDDENFVKIVDRKKDMLISGGLNVYPAEIERVLAGHPHVLEVAVVATRDEKFGERPVAVVVSDKPELTLSDLEPVLAELADYKRPVRLEVVDELPRTMSGKVIRRALAERYHEPAQRGSSQHA
ncbi:AMP-binding protein [Nocardia harenae]|uniref:AMP-binding protein n=1 Tax=Nocardia harenae TaxID=358707 RepID=UPI000833EEC1|nr:AMP-binding protein [Nocardia harenae]